MPERKSMTKTYTRPIGSDATTVGERNRTRWTRYLRKRLKELVHPMAFISATENSVADALQQQRASSAKYPWQDRPTWTNARIRIDQMATLELLQKRHLKATGKEISKAEVLAALMACGLDTIINHEDFGGTTA